ncbi:hypothetical protein Mal64_30160 [Pseudobythopirellula maris]|uniref:Ice-binding protein C-terminal domain-containing protein n=1 Tax=Pseudobythopirellula maris TaxID=2527991 RepID=A0A5C5ZKA2_9BACT|nr:PEP-CTERM sorting domain-containing protein [Pseudobythopirellula maris]TWT87477.1 hypothetical protein Mal64_30160 [Pseudobythopirellula maris]
MNRIFFALLTIAALTASQAQAATIEYSLNIAGVDPADYLTMPAGEYTLEVWAQVSDNDIGGGFNGGLLSYAFQLNTEEDAVLDFVEGMSGPPVNRVPSGKWDSVTPNSLFANKFQGELDSGLGSVSGDVFAQTGSMGPGDFDNNFDAIGVGSPTLLVSGPIELGLGIATIEVSGLATQHIVYGATGATESDDVIPASITIGNIPEPASAMLAGLAVAGVLGYRRRSC